MARNTTSPGNRPPPAKERGELSLKKTRRARPNSVFIISIRKAASKPIRTALRISEVERHHYYGENTLTAPTK